MNFRARNRWTEPSCIVATFGRSQRNMDPSPVTPCYNRTQVKRWSLLTNMYHKFSGFLKVFLPLGIVSIIFSALLLLLAIPSTLDYKSPEFLLFLYGILASVTLMICGIVLVIKGNLFWKKIQVDEYGIFLVNRNGTKVATYLWSDIKKLVISSGNGKRYRIKAFVIFLHKNLPL